MFASTRYHALRNLGVARGWYLKTLLQNPQDLAHFSRVATAYHESTGKHLGRDAARAVYENLSLFKSAEDWGVDYRDLLRNFHFSNPKAPNIKEFFAELQDQIVDAIAQNVGDLPDHIRSGIKENPARANSLLAYFRANPDAVRALLEYDRDALLDLKWGHTGLQEKVRRLIERVNSADISVGKKGDLVLRVADDVLSHLHGMNVPGSCMSASGSRSYGAFAVTGGPALVFYAQDRNGNVRGRVVYYLYRSGFLGRPVFVPNKAYGDENILKLTQEILREHGLPVHRFITPPLLAKPAASRFYHRIFYKDGVKGGEIIFRPY